MRILVFSTAYYPFVGGAEVAIREIASRLPHHTWELITARMSRAVPSHEKIGNVHVYRVGFGNATIDKFLLPLFGVVRAIQLRRRGRIDLVWSMMASQGSVGASLYKKLFPSTPLVLNIQEGDEEEHLKRYVGGNELLFKFLIQPWHRMVFRSANRITAISRYLKRRALAAGARGHVSVVPNGVDLDFFSPGPQKEKRDEYVLISTSRFVEKNANEYIIRALPLLPPHVVFWSIGTGPLDASLRALARSLGVEKRVTFLGNPGHEAIRDYLRKADVFVRPSLSEGLGISFLEAMAVGLPIVGTLVGGIPDFLMDGETGFACEPRSAESVAAAVERIMEKPEQAREIALAGQSLVRERYDWRMIAPMIEADFVAAIPTAPTLLIATGIYPPDVGGPATYAKGLYDALSIRAPRTAVLSYTLEKRLPTGIRHIVTFFKMLFALLFVDGVIALDTYSVGLPAVAAAKILRKRVLVRIGGDFLWESYINRTHEDIVLSDFYTRARELSYKERVIRSLTRWVLRGADTIVFSTEWQKKFMPPAYGIPASKSIVVIENNEGVRVPAHEPTVKNFLWAGRSIFLKNTVRLRLAFEKARRINPELRLDMCEHVSHEELLRRISHAYAVVLPSISEVSPNLVLESIACGKPFIATRECGYAERFGNMGIFFDPLSIDDIARAMLEMAEDARYKEYEMAIESYDHRHTYSDIANEWIAAFSRA